MLSVWRDREIEREGEREREREGGREGMGEIEIKRKRDRGREGQNHIMHIHTFIVKDILQKKTYIPWGH